MVLQKTRIRLLTAGLLIGFVLCSGCMVFNPLQPEPIVGIWVWTSSYDGSVYIDTFVKDGTYVSTSSDLTVPATTGTWTKIRTNEYLVKCDDGSTYTWIYHQETDTITQPEYPDQPSYRQGKQPVTTIRADPGWTASSPIILFSDDFSQWQSLWSNEVMSSSSGSAYVSGGKLYIRDPKPPGGSMYHQLHSSYADFILDVDTTLVDGTFDNWIGADVREASNGDCYSFAISSDGYYSISKIIGGEVISLVGPVKSDYINIGKGATNHLTIECNDNSLILKVNGHQVGTATDNSLSAGTISLKASANDDNSFVLVAFDNFEISSI